MGFFSSVFQGRVNRSTFFGLTLLIAVIAALVLPILQLILLFILQNFLPGETATNIILVGKAIVIVVFIIFSYVLCIKRLHDVGASGWFSVLYLILGIMGVALSLIPGQKNVNKYGKPPKPGIHF